MNIIKENEGMEATTFMAIGPLVAILMWIIIGVSCSISERGQTGDFLGGVASPIFGFTSAMLVYLSFQQQIKANRIQIEALRQEIEARKEESKRNGIRSVLIQLRTELSDLIYVNPIDDNKTYHGMQAFEIFIDTLSRIGRPALLRNENVADTIYGVALMLQKELASIHSDKNILNKEIADELHIFYALKLAKGLNTLDSINQDGIINDIKASKKEIVNLFRQYGYDV